MSILPILVMKRGNTSTNGGYKISKLAHQFLDNCIVASLSAKERSHWCNIWDSMQSQDVMEWSFFIPLQHKLFTPLWRKSLENLDIFHLWWTFVFSVFELMPSYISLKHGLSMTKKKSILMMDSMKLKKYSRWLHMCHLGSFMCICCFLTLGMSIWTKVDHVENHLSHLYKPSQDDYIGDDWVSPSYNRI